MGKPVLALPKEILTYPDALRNSIIRTIQEAQGLPQERQLEQAGEEHNMWAQNSDPLLAFEEDELYNILVSEAAWRIARLFVGMGLPVDGLDMQKSFGADYLDFEANVLMKGKDTGRNKMSEWIKKLASDQRKRFMKWLDNGEALTPKEINQVDVLLSKPSKERHEQNARTAEAYSVRAGFLGKLRGQADREHLDMLGAVVDRFPDTIKAATKAGINVTRRGAAKEAKATGKTVKVLPLTPREQNAVAHATQSAGDKITDVSERHRMEIRQLVIQAKRERWTAQQLASKLFDKFGDHNRDWRRVAITELAYAHNDAFLAGCEEGATVIGMGAVDACKHCKTHVIGKTFTVTHTVPKKETFDTDTNWIWLGKSNYGRKVAELRAALPMHPHCRCRWHVLSRFYKVGDNGKLVLKSTAELINEERAKLGLEPDTRIQESKLSLEELAQQTLDKLNSK